MAISKQEVALGVATMTVTSRGPTLVRDILVVVGDVSGLIVVEPGCGVFGAAALTAK